MRIRKFRGEDLENILEMTRDAWNGASFDQMLERKFGKKGRNWWEYKANSIKKFIEEHPDWVFVAEDEGRIIGYATYSIDKERRIGGVLNNAVHPNWRGKAIGGKLHRRVLKELKKRGMEIAILVTSFDNIPARRMYKSTGFKEFWHSLYYAMKLE